MKKKDIELAIKKNLLSEGYTVSFKKSELFLKEEDTNGGDAIYVEPTDTSTGAQQGISTAINDASKNNPTEHDFKVNTSDFNGTSADDKIGVDINAKNGFDAERQIRSKMQNPAMKQMAGSGKAMMNVHIADSKKAKSVVDDGRRFKKKDFDKFIGCL